MPLVVGFALVRGGTWAAVARLASVALAFLIAALVARILQPDEVGVYFSVLAVVSIAALVGSLGTWTPITAFVAEADSGSSFTRRSVIRRGFAISGYGVLLVVGLMLIGFPTLAQSLVGTLGSVHWWVIASLTAVFVFRDVMTESLRSLSDIRSASIVQTAPQLFLAGLLVVFWVLRPALSLGAVLASVAVAHGIALGLGAGLLLRYIGTEPAGGAAPSVRRYLGLGLPWVGTSLLVAVAVQAGVIVAAATSSTSEAALFGAAYRMAFFVGIPSVIVNSVLPPFVARYWAQRDWRSLEKLIRSATTVASASALLAFAVVVGMGRPILSLVFGDFYVEAWPSVVVLAAGFLVETGLGKSARILVLLNEERAVALVVLVATSVALGLMWALGGRLGSLGVAIGATIGLVMSNGGLVLVAKRRLAIWILPYGSFSNLEDIGALFSGRTLR